MARKAHRESSERLMSVEEADAAFAKYWQDEVSEANGGDDTAELTQRSEKRPPERPPSEDS